MKFLNIPFVLVGLELFSVAFISCWGWHGATLVLQKLFFKQILVDFDAPLGDVYEHAQVVEYVAQTEKVLPIRLRKLLIIEILEKVLQPLILDEEGSDDLFLGKFEQDLDQVCTRVLVKDLKSFQNQSVVNLSDEIVLLDYIFNDSLVLRSNLYPCLLIVDVASHGENSYHQIVFECSWIRGACLI